MKRSITLFSYASYLCIGFFWMVTIAGMLYSPYLLRFFSKKKTLNVLAWGGVFDPLALAQFTEKTGINVNVSFYTTNEELLVYLNATKGRGYDIIVPSDYAVTPLKNQKLIKKIDKSKLDFLPRINPNLMGYSFDENNDYSLPYMVEIFGLGYDKKFFKGTFDNPHWSWIFNPHGFKIVMVNDPIEAVVLAARYLYKTLPKSALPEQIRAIRDLLTKQRQWVEAYSDFRPDYFLLTRNCPLVVTAYSSYLKAAQQDLQIGFAVPVGGTFISIENIAISVSSEEDEAIYQFINYVYTNKVIKQNYLIKSSLPATFDVLKEISLDDVVHTFLTQPRTEFIKNVLFFSPIMSESLLHELWIAVKSRP